MVDLSFWFRVSTEDEILTFSEEFSNECRLNPAVKFYTAILQNENYAIFAIKEENNEVRILFFLILEHSLRDVVNLYNLFCAFVKKMTYIEPNKENYGKSRRICWNLQNKQNHMYFEEVIYKKGGEIPLNFPEIYKDGCLVEYNLSRSAWKEKVNLVDRYYYEQTLSTYEETPMSREKYSDRKYAILTLHILNGEIFELTPYLTYRNYDRQTKKIIPISKNVLNTINIYCENMLANCNDYITGDPVWTETLEKEMMLLKEYAEKEYNEIWKVADINEPYLADIKAKLARIFRLIREFELPAKEE